MRDFASTENTVYNTMYQKNSIMLIPSNDRYFMQILFRLPNYNTTETGDFFALVVLGIIEKPEFFLGIPEL